MRDQDRKSNDSNLDPSKLRALRTTPFRDLLRGRVTGRLDLKYVLDSSALPPPLIELVARVVRRTRLKRLERVEVARELIEHFEDGLAAGMSGDELVMAFGEERTAAILIRRGVARKRSWFVRAAHRTVVAASLLFTGFLAVYLVLAVRYWNQPVRIDVDYVAMIREDSKGPTPEARSWPEIRAAITRILELAGPTAESGDRGVSSIVDVAMAETVPPWLDAVTASSSMVPADDAPSKETGDEFFDRAEPMFDALRLAAGKPVLGFPMGLDGTGTKEDRAFFGLIEPDPDLDAEVESSILDGAVISLQFPYYGTIRLAARMLSVDARRAAVMGDGSRMVADVEAMLGLGRQVRNPTILIGQLVGLAIERLAFNTMLDVLASNPGAIDDDSLARLEAIVGGLDDERLRIRIDHERYFFLDLAQRFYTDDGEGNGRLKFVSVPVSPSAFETSATEISETFDFLAGPLVAGVTMDRRGAIEIWNRNLDRIDAGNSIEPWEIDVSNPHGVDGPILDEADASWFSKLRLFPVSMLLSPTDHLVNVAGAIRLERDLVRTVIELELFRRTHGSWPTSNDTVGFVGRDPFDGESLRYVLKDGIPMIYILGPDRIDDGGAWIKGRNGIDRVAREGLAGTSKYWGRIPNYSGEGLLGDVPVWIGRSLDDASDPRP